MTTLLGIADDLQALLALADEESADGELSDELERWFAEIGDQQSSKVDGYCSLIRSQELEASALGAEIDRLQRRQAARRNLAQRLKDRLKLYLELTGQKKLQCKRFTAAICGNGGKLSVDTRGLQLEALPEELVRTTRQPDVDAIREALEAGKNVPGCRLMERETHLRIS